MAYKFTSGSVTSLSSLFDALDSFLLGTLGWTLAHSGTEMGGPFKIYHSTGESGSEDIYIGVYKYRYNSELCGFQFAGYTGVNTGNNSFDDQPGSWCASANCAYCQFDGFPGIPLLDNGTTMKYWFFGDLDYFFIVVKLAGGNYVNAYAGLMLRHFSNDVYPCVVLGSTRTFTRFEWGCTCCYWCWYQNPLPYRKYTYECQERCAIGYQRNTDNSGWCGRLVTSIYGTHYSKQCLGPTNLVYLLYNLYSSRSHGFLLSPIYVDVWYTGPRGELKYIYHVQPGTLPSESVVHVGGDPYIVFNWVSSEYNARMQIAVRYYE